MAAAIVDYSNCVVDVDPLLLRLPASSTSLIPSLFRVRLLAAQTAVLRLYSDALRCASKRLLSKIWGIDEAVYVNI